MFRIISVLLVSLFMVSGCISTETSAVHQISAREANAIRLNQLDLVNAVRAQAGVPPLTLSAELTAAALTHARDIAVQKRAWNFGSDRSAPQTRAERAGFTGLITGEDVAETFMSNIEIFQAWAADSRSRQAMIDARATHMGFGWFQEANGKLWWVMDIGASVTPLEVAMAE
ncbi:MAG: CAP domain-containing protein [Rhodobacteraceae bacterium]|nr:CAP domain-containing protein [Paracoccaceae bacterium]